MPADRKCLFCGITLACVLCLAVFPVSVRPQNILPEEARPSIPSPPPDGMSRGKPQDPGIESFLTRFNGCSWYKSPSNPTRDVYLELRDGTLTLYEYLKDQFYCYSSFRACFSQEELWRARVTGYSNFLTDTQGNPYIVVINPNGQTIEVQDIENTSGKQYATSIFVRLRCPDTIKTGN